MIDTKELKVFGFTDQQMEQIETAASHLRHQDPPESVIETMKRWDVFTDGKWFDSIQARNHSEALLEALRKLDLDDEAGLDVRLAAQ